MRANLKPGWILLLIGRLALAGIFLAAGYMKLREPWLQFAITINNLKILPSEMLEPLAKYLPWAEVALGVAILSGIWLRWFSLLGAVVLAMFLSVLIRSYAMGLQVDCGCFGSGEPLGPKSIARDSLMLVLAVAVTIGAFRASRKRSGTLPQADPARPDFSGIEPSHPV